MAYDKVVDSAKLDAAMSATADAIREKTDGADSIAWDDSTGFANAVSGVYDAGKKAEYKSFWDSFLKDSTGFAWRFAGRGWNDYTFNPDRDIIFGYEMSNYCFAYNEITDLEAILKRKNVILDTSGTPRIDYLFWHSAKITCVPEIVISESVTMAQYVFCECKALHTIRKLVFPNKSNFNIVGMFGNCTALVNLTIGGTIAVTGIDLHWSTLLSRDSITSVINALSDTTTGNVYYVCTGSGRRGFFRRGMVCVDSDQAKLDYSIGITGGAYGTKDITRG